MGIQWGGGAWNMGISLRLVGGLWLREGTKLAKHTPTRRSLALGRGKLPEDQKFVDKCRIVAVGGKGGSGCVSFYRDNKVQYGGPDGASGGNGGDIIIRAAKGLMDLSREHYSYNAENGVNGQGLNKIGRHGKAQVVLVPVGTVVKVQNQNGPSMDDDKRMGKVTKITHIMQEQGSTKGPKVRKLSKHNTKKGKENQKMDVVDQHDEEEGEEDGEEDGEKDEWEETREMAVAEAEEAWTPEQGGRKSNSRGFPGMIELTSHETVYEQMMRITGQDVGPKSESGDELDEDAEYVTIADLDEDGQELIVAPGGRGGRGNLSFSSKKYRAPKKAEEGMDGKKVRVELELKSLADVGLIGFPNAGKSSLLAALSNATPKIASYPFTTLRPNLGVVNFDYHDTFTIADIPGIIEGAHQDIGLGHTFLRHVERASMLVYVLDTAGVDGRQAWNDLNVLQDELDKYMPGLSRRATLIIANKMDLPEAQAGFRDLEWRLEALLDRDGLCPLTRARLIKVSCHSREGLDEAVKEMHRMINERRSLHRDKITGETLEFD